MHETLRRLLDDIRRHGAAHDMILMPASSDAISMGRQLEAEGWRRDGSQWPMMAWTPPRP